MSTNNDRMHPVFKELLAAPADPDAPAIEDRSIEDLREEFADDMRAMDKEAPEVESVEDVVVAGPAGGIPVRVYVGAALRPRTDSIRGLGAAPVGRDRGPTVVYIHGGGFFRGSIDTHDSICRVLAAETGGTVVSPDYRLPPENVFPAALEDCYAVLKWTAEKYANLIVAGDSAGATHAAALTLKARDEDGPTIAGQILYYPSVDHATPDAWESNTLFAKGYWLDSGPYCIDQYLPDVNSRTHPYASPLLADSHAGLPPAYICTAGFDPLRDQGAAYAEKLSDAGVEVRYENLDNMLHGFVSCRGLVEEADELIKRSVQNAG